jgi:hypothetical protein
LAKSKDEPIRDPDPKVKVEGEREDDGKVHRSEDLRKHGSGQEGKLDWVLIVQPTDRTKGSSRHTWRRAAQAGIAFLVSLWKESTNAWTKGKIERPR